MIFCSQRRCEPRTVNIHYMYVICILLYIYSYAYIYTYTYTYIYMYMYTYMYVYITGPQRRCRATIRQYTLYICYRYFIIHIYMCIYINIYIYIHMYICMHIYIYIWQGHRDDVEPLTGMKLETVCDGDVQLCVRHWDMHTIRNNV